jgi:hypothetical protein
MSSDFAGTIGRINLAGTSAGLLGTHGATKSKTYASTGVPLHVRIALLRHYYAFNRLPSLPRVVKLMRACKLI